MPGVYLNNIDDEESNVLLRMAKLEGQVILPRTKKGKQLLTGVIAWVNNTVLPSCYDKIRD